MTRYSNGTVRGRRLVGPEIPWDGSAVDDVRKDASSNRRRDVARGTLGGLAGGHAGMIAGGAANGGFGFAREVRRAGMGRKEQFAGARLGAALGGAGAAMDVRALRSPVTAAGAALGAAGGAKFVINRGRKPARARQYRDVSDVGKAAGAALQATLADRGNAMAFAGGWRNQKQKKKIAALQSQVQTQQPQQPDPVGKAQRKYDPEAARQRRLGAGIATGALAGTAALGLGGRGIVRSTKAVRGLSLGLPGAKSGPGASKELKSFVHGKGHGDVVAARRRDVALAGGGTVALGGAGVAHHEADRRRFGTWR